ncbi:MAG TPA: O-antigen ligase family protein [Bryobacteraceae bacterium]
MGVSSRPAPVTAPWVIALAVLSAAPTLKLGDVQSVELLQVLWLCLSMPTFLHRGLRVPVSGVWRHYGLRYVAFLGVCIAVSLMALRLTFYTPPGVSVLKRPVILSLARILELCLAVYFMLALARSFQIRRSLLRLALGAYTWAGVFSACVSILGWLLLEIAGISTFPVYGFDARVRGFFNEGGPYGIFLVSVFVVVLLRARLFHLPYPFLHKAALCVLAVALFLTGSKAAILAGAVLGAIGFLSSRSRVQALAWSGLCAVVLIAALGLLGGRAFGYLYAYTNFEESLAYRPGDPSLIMGRVAAALIVPRIIEAHPLLGIGVGNYSLMRNDPEYLQGMPSVAEWDLPGVGLFGSAAEFGIPATLFFVAALLRPLLQARRRRAAAIVAVAAGFQPVAFLLGVNLNFFYPWLVAAFAIAQEAAPRPEQGLPS